MDGIRPDYQGGGIVNLMASLVAALGGEELVYPPLSLLPPAALRDSRNVVLLVIDGLGYHYLRNSGQADSFRAHLLGGLTSVFPPTTAAAITTFLTGTAPQQHGLTGWFVHFRELGDILAVLPFTSRHGGAPLSGPGLDVATFLGHTPFFDRIPVRSHCVAPRFIAHSPFNRAHTGKSEVHAYVTLSECFDAVTAIVQQGRDRQYVYAYWPELDALAHRHGIGSLEVENHLAELDSAFRDFLQAIAGTDTTVLVTADHGFVDSSTESRLELADHPRIADSLVMPLCGERRLAYCYIHPEKGRQFEAAVHEELAGKAVLWRGRDLIGAGFFGLGAPHPRLADRVGHYALAMTGNYTLQDDVPGEERYVHVGNHGGMSEAELLVPLCVAQV